MNNLTDPKDQTERHDFWLFLFSCLLKKEENIKGECITKNRDQKSCLSARLIQKPDLLFFRKPDETAVEDNTKDVEDNSKDDKEPKENKDDTEVELIYL